ncbi:MAG TPA: AmmeMemoRadiSam system protein B, partial [Azospira sp.]|nr:AmmeMemoRadiSam system protein B [Azospira sp.]
MSQLHPPRPPAVAGLFYPADPAELARSIRAYLAAVVPPGPLGPIKALIVPHAGYIYSAPIAAAAYRALADQAQSIRRVILLGPTHRVAVRGVAVPSVPAFTTPLGPVAVDDGARQAIADLPQVVINDAPHAQEHALEVQLPFLQTVLDDFQCLPLAVGQASTAEVAEVL